MTTKLEDQSLSAAPAAMPVEPVVNKAEIFCEPGDMPSPAHGGLARFVYYRLKLAGVEIASRSARYRWEPSFDVDKHEWPSDLVAMRDAINRALATPPAPAVADGWVLVPKVSTEEMRIAGEEAYWMHPKDEDACTAMAAAYVSMLAASPRPAPAVADGMIDAFNRLGAELERLPASEEQTQLSMMLQSLKRRVLRYRDGKPSMKLHFDDEWLRQFADIEDEILIGPAEAASPAVAEGLEEAIALAWDFVKPSLVKQNEEVGPAGVWSTGFRSGWEACSRAASPAVPAVVTISRERFREKVLSSPDLPCEAGSAASPAPATPAEVERLREENERLRSEAIKVDAYLDADADDMYAANKRAVAAEAALSEANKRLDKLEGALRKSAEGWSNVAELKLVPPQHMETVIALRDESRAALNTIKGGEKNGA